MYLNDYSAVKTEFRGLLCAPQTDRGMDSNDASVLNEVTMLSAVFVRENVVQY